MSNHVKDAAALLAQLREHMTQGRYSTWAIDRYLVNARQFLRHLAKLHVRIDEATPAHVAMHLRCELRRYRRRQGHAPTSMVAWRRSHTAGIHRLLHAVRGQWSVDLGACNPSEALCRELSGKFEQWLNERRGLAPRSIEVLAAEARRFLLWHVQRTGASDIADLQITDVDTYVLARCPPLRRVSRKNVAGQLRCFLRFLYATERTTRDLASGVVAPTLYAFEAIPSALHPEQIRDVLTWTRQDRSPKGLRDYAILMLLSTYGLRAGEIVQLRLEDLDWRADRLWVCHTKTGSRSALPLVPDVGEAILEYLRRGRPIVDAREIFIHTRAPYIPLKRGSSLYPTVRSRLEAAGVNPTGKRGPHAFRHAHAVRLLRASVTVKTIGDLLGHRSAASTTPYLKLATADLRAVALEIPGQEVQA